MQTDTTRAMPAANVGQPPSITYEGINLSRHDEHYRRGHSVPGEIVRLDPDSRVPGVHPDTVAARVGPDPRMVTTTIVTGVEIDDPINDDGKVVRTTVDFELDGVDGRHDAKAFQPEGERSHDYGAIVERSGRTWLVPLDISMGHTEADDVIRFTGIAREIVGFGGRHMGDFHDEVHADSFDGFREKVAAAPLSGEFDFQSAVSHGDRHGPVRLLGAPMMELATEQEVAVAREAIDHALGTIRMEALATASKKLIRDVSALADGDEAPAVGSAITDLADALHVRDRNRTDRTDRYVVLGAERLLSDLDDVSRSGMPAYDALSKALDEVHLEYAAGTSDPKIATHRNGDDRAHQYAALAMGRLRGMGLIPFGRDQELQDAFEAEKLAPMLDGLDQRGDGVRMEAAERAAKEMEAAGLLKRGVDVDVVGTLAGVLAMPIGDVRECLGVPSRAIAVRPVTSRGPSPHAADPVMLQLSKRSAQR